MLFQPSIIALLVAAGLGTLMLLAATPFAVQVIRRWNIASGSAAQLQLERRTYLFSTLLGFVLATQLAALLLFVFTADRLAEMFVGAMCAVGTLNVNRYGFPALIAQIVLFFLAALWLIVDHLDNQAPDYPLIRVKYALMIGLLPLQAGALWLEFSYFRGLRANIITSCCGSMFSGEAPSLAGELSSLPPQPAFLLFFGALALVVGLALRHWRHPGAFSGYALGAAGGAAFAAAIAGILAFLSLYIYEHPHHHCPFCILKPEYDYRGYALYLPLFVATAAGLGAAAIQPCARLASLRQRVPALSARLAAVAAGGFLLFAILAAVFILTSNLVLVES